ncbi:TonB-dependent receptor plug domain-containing protein [Acinetobacter courvalinii]|uniref:TonB-dependent receptor plug domain-containing protein n=1 Tax=Acinetobacter courvalinii TaxID=280147 RepID=UPI0021D24830|nr:TonB-dependent receptor [Acinetobacter courvalinii]MCU4369125.1 TonB-dependent receptor [Acinetobacter courvalinii]MCU4447330.1 TonB-dependent receptor [Acinetobacter courvalinii]
MSTVLQPTRLVGAIAIAMGFSSPAFAQDQASDKTATLDTIVVTASRSEQKIEDVPARINIIEPKILEQSPIASLPQLLQTDASINMVQTGGYGQAASIFLRGTNSNHTLLLRDGVRLNSNTSGAASLPFIDTTDIKQIEVLKGPASVLYGADAIGGVVQLISKTPEKTSAFVTGEIGEHKTYKSVVGADLAENGFYAQIRGQRLETDGTPVTDAKNNKKASFDQKGYSAKVGIDKAQYAASVDYSENQGYSDYDNYGNLVSQDFKNEAINVKGRLNVLDNLAVHARLSQYKDNIDQNTSSDYVHSTTQEAELYTKWQITPAQNILVGSTFKDIKGDVYSKNLYGGQDVKYKESVDTIGYFAQHQYQHNGLDTQVGIRVEDNDKFGTHTVGQGAIRYQVLPLTSVYANVGSAFRAPTTNDLYALSWGANPDLKPEESFSYEIGVDQKLNHNIDLGLSIYRNKVDNLISFQAGKLINVNKATFTGGEASFKWQQDELFLTTTYAYVQAKDDETKKDLTRRPRQSLTLTTGWDDGEYGVSASVVAKSNSKDFADWPSTIPTTTPGYVTTNVNVYWQPIPMIKLFANIENIGDVNYKTAYNGNGVYYINGGRQASAGVTFRY